jgi:lysophospholipase L1-like esterase
MARLIVCDGDSLTLGTQSSSADKPYPALIKFILGTPKWTVTNLGISGQSLVTCNTNAAANVDSLYSAGNAANICILWAGTNDIKLNSRTAAQVYADTITYGQARQAVGWKVVVCTTLPRQNDAAFETTRLTLNASIRANWATFADALADVGNEPVLGPNAAASANLLYYHADQIHLIDNGYEHAAQIVKVALLTLSGVSVATMAFTEFCCRSGGSNLNAGTRTGSSTEPGTGAAFTYASGTWVASTGVFTVASGNPSTDGVASGDFVSVYPDAATVAVFVGRVTLVTATQITVSLTAKAGTAPVDGTTNTTLKVGGAWKGPNAASAFPFGFVQSTLTDAAGDAPRINFKNDAQYNITAAMTHANAGPITWQGYTTAYGDFGRATIDGGTSGSSYILLTLSGVDQRVVDVIFNHNGATGQANALATSAQRILYERCVAANMRGSGFTLTQNNTSAIECEAYACNAANVATLGGFTCNITTTFLRCVAHDNAGANNDGFFVGGNNAALINCIADTNGRAGINHNVASGGGIISGCDCYNNGADGIKLSAASSFEGYHIDNCNLVNNTGYGINGSGAGIKHGTIINCGFGAGTKANTSGQTNALNSMEVINAVTYPIDVTPWVDPANGDFRIALTQAKGAGRGSFTETQASYAGTVGYPDIGAAQHLETFRGFLLL